MGPKPTFKAVAESITLPRVLGVSLYGSYTEIRIDKTDVAFRRAGRSRKSLETLDSSENSRRLAWVPLMWSTHHNELR